MKYLALLFLLTTSCGKLTLELDLGPMPNMPTAPVVVTPPAPLEINMGLVDNQVLVLSDVTDPTDSQAYTLTGTCLEENEMLEFTLDEDFGALQLDASYSDYVPTAQCINGQFSVMLLFGYLFEPNMYSLYDGPVEIKARYASNPSLGPQTVTINKKTVGILASAFSMVDDVAATYEGYFDYFTEVQDVFGSNIVTHSRLNGLNYTARSAAVLNPRRWDPTLNSGSGGYDHTGTNDLGGPILGEFKYSPNDSCTGGTWQDIPQLGNSVYFDFPIPNGGAVVTYSVIYRDISSNFISDCKLRKFKHQ